MNGRQHLSDLELDVNLRAAALASFSQELAAHRADLLAHFDDAGWSLARESHTVAAIIDTHRRVLERFLTQQADILRTRVAAEIESTIVAALAEAEALAMAPDVLEHLTNAASLDRRSVSRAVHPSVLNVGVDTDQIGTGNSEPDAAAEPDAADGITTSDSASPFLDGIDSSLLFGTSPSLARTEDLVESLLAEWARSEHEEAKALVDDAHARATVLQHLAAEQSATATETSSESAPDESAAPVEPAEHENPHRPAAIGDIAAELSSLLAGGAAGDIEQTLAALARSLDTHALASAPLTWGDDAGAADTPSPFDAAPPEAAVVGVAHGLVDDAASAAHDIGSRTDEQLELAFADFWTGDLARQALDAVLPEPPQRSDLRAARRQARRAHLAAQDSHRASTRSTLVSGIVPIVGMTAVITLLMALVG